MNSSMRLAPKVSRLVSIMSGTGFIAPFGRSRSFRYMFIGLVNMWRSFVVGRITRKATKVRTWATQSAWCHTAGLVS